MNEPPSIPLPPMGVRYPLYADEVATVGEEHVEEHVGTAEETQAWSPDWALDEAPRPRRTVGRLAVVVGLVLLLGIALLGWQLLAVHHATQARHTASVGGGAASKPLALSATAPVTAPPGRDTAGHETTYSAANMVDDDPTTAWRMSGDGTGTTLTFTLSHPATITSVGLVNGYAKTESGMDWYAGNRRVLEVEWRFDDGTTLKQALHDTRSLQRLSVDRVRTGSIKLTLLKVSAPGKGAASRDMTAISEVRVAG